MRKNAWKEEEINELKEMVAVNKTWEDIARKLGRTEVAVRIRATSLGIKRVNDTFSKDELDYIKSNYPEKSIHTLKKELGVSWETVKNALNNMEIGIELRDKAWTEEEINKLKEYATDKTIKETASLLGRTETSIRIKSSRLGLLILTAKRKWTQAEENYLKQNWGDVSLTTLAHNLSRGREAVLQRAHKLKLPPIYNATEFINLSEVEEYTGITRDRIRLTLEPKMGFPLIRKVLVNKRILLVDIDELLLWMEKNQDQFDGRKVQEGIFIPEPDWLIMKRRQDFKSKENIHYQVKKKLWIKNELAYAISLLNIGTSYEEIANRVGRSKQAVQARLNKEGKSYRLTKFWTGKEFKFIQDNYKTMTDEEIASNLNRSVKSVESQRLALGIKRGQRGRNKKKTSREE